MAEDEAKSMAVDEIKTVEGDTGAAPAAAVTEGAGSQEAAQAIASREAAEGAASQEAAEGVAVQALNLEAAAAAKPARKRGRLKGSRKVKTAAAAMSDVELLEAVEAAAKSGKPDERLAPPTAGGRDEPAAKRGRPAKKAKQPALKTQAQIEQDLKQNRERIGFCSRATTETAIEIQINLDGGGSSDIDTGIGFLDHMLTLLARHGFLDLSVQARGDLDVDCHHTIEDCGIVLGTALKDALGTKAGIHRYGNCFIPMDEALAQVCLDFSGRPYIVFDADLPIVQIGNYDSEMTEEFFRAVAVASGMTLHIRVLYGKNLHHMIEAIFKAFARALSEAVAYDPRVHGVMSSKGIL